MTRREIVEQREVLAKLAKTYPHRTIENIIQNLDARIEEYDKERDYICIKGDEYLQKGKVYKVRFDGEKYCLEYSTKNEHDLLFQKMHEAGYMWDSETKQLLSLKAEPSGEQRSIDKDKTEIYDQFTPFEERLCALIHACQILSDEGKIKFIKKHSQEILDIAKKQIEIEQKPAWSEEDEKIITGIINDIQKRLEDYPLEQLAEIYFKEIKWLKSLRKRIEGE